MQLRLHLRSVPIELGRLGACALAIAALSTASLRAQETDVTQTPNSVQAGIQKSFAEQVGAGRGDLFTPGSSAFLIARDPFRAIARGRQIFQRKFQLAQGLGPRTNDGTGDLDRNASLAAGLADSCASCHGRPQGSAGFGGDVFTRPTSRDAPHLFGLGLHEMLADEITSDLRAIRSQALSEAAALGTPVTAALHSKGVSYGSITVHPAGRVDTDAVVGVDADLRIRPFFAQGGTISIREFLVGAFNAEMGLESADRDLLLASIGARIVTPAGMVLDGSLDRIEAPPAPSTAADPDGDGITDEIPQSVVDFMEFYLLNYFKPAVRSEARSNEGRKGLATMQAIGCTVCHVPTLTIDHDRRVADVETRLDRSAGNPFNQLFATASPLFDETDDSSGLPTLKEASGGPFAVENFFADLKRHDLGPGFWERNFDGTIQKQFMTEPLWGVGSTAPYGHDGRSNTLEDVILRHGGEAQASRDAFAALDPTEAEQVLAFLRTLVLFSPPATASNLDPKDPAFFQYPMGGHGSIKLSVLFVDPRDKE